MIPSIVICTLFFVFSLIFSRRRWYAPTVLLCGVWLISLLAYAWIDHGMHPLSPAIVRAITWWIAGFCISAWAVQSVYIKPLFCHIPSSHTARDIYYYLSLATLPVMIIEVILVIIHSGGNPFSALRDANVAGVNGIRTTAFFVLFWMVSYIMELQVASKRNIGRIIFLLLINLFYAFISMGKMNFMILFLATAIILSQRPRFRFRYLVIGASLLLLLFVGVQQLRGSYTNPKHFAALYLTSSLGNLNTNLQPESAQATGENTFRLYYAIKAKLDNGKTQPVNPILEFKRVEVGEFVFGSNTYTCLYPFYKDFGLKGVITFGILLGALFGYLFKTAEDDSECALILYAILAGTIAMQFIGDTFFTVLSQNIQYLIATVIPYIISKFHHFERKTHPQ